MENETFLNPEVPELILELMDKSDEGKFCLTTEDALDYLFPNPPKPCI